jgi:hypothetical protein
MYLKAKKKQKKKTDFVNKHSFDYEKYHFECNL